MKRKILLSILGPFMLFECLSAQFTVSGKAYSSPDEMTQTPLEGVRIYSEWPYFETYTDVSGNYTFNNVPSGSLLTIHAEKVGYIFTPVTIERLVNKDFTNCNFVGAVTSSSVPVTFYYKATGSPVNVYLAGSMNGYNQADVEYKLTNNGNGIFTITKNLEPNDYVYKYVVDGNWVTDPYNPVTDGSEYNNSKISVSDPMITYLLPAFNESYSTTSLPEIKATVATNNNNLSLTNYSLKINSNAISGTPSLSNSNKVLTYTPSAGELQNGNNTCELSFTVSGQTATQTISFQYIATGGGGGFSVSGKIKTADNTPVSGVTIDYRGQSVSTDVNGAYSVSGIKAPIITLIPSKSGYIFSPEQIVLMIDKDYTGQDFVASTSNTGDIEYSISGMVTACGEPIEGVAVESRGQTYYTNASGQYTVSGSLVYNGTYYEPAQFNLTFSKTGYIFDEFGSNEKTYTSVKISSNPTLNDENFTAKKGIDNITGIITYPDGTPGAGIALNIRDERAVTTETIMTDAEGKYFYPVAYPSKSNDFPTSYRIEPVSNIYRFEPLSINVDNTQTCDYLKNKNFSATLAPTPICMVSVSETGHNIVVWEKPDINVISGFKIYRESNVANMYDLIGYVPYTETAVFEDANSEPTTKAYRYKIGTVNTYNGAETDLSGEHKTIHLTINKGTGNAWNLIWSHYEGLEISTYKLFRGETKETMTFLTDIAGNLNSYTDNTAPIGNMYYQIEMVLEDACNPEVAKPLLKSTKAGSIYSSTKSNIANSANPSTDINKIIEDKNFIYPNPVENTLYFKNSKALNEFEIYSIQGALIKQGVLNTSIDVSNLQSGLYHIRVKNDEKWESFRFIKK